MKNTQYLKCLFFWYCRIILLHKSTATKFQQKLEGLEITMVDVHRTLVFYQAGINLKPIKKRFKSFTKIKMSDSPSEVATAVEMFIQLHKSFGKLFNTSSY